MTKRRMNTDDKALIDEKKIRLKNNEVESDIDGNIEKETLTNDSENQINGVYVRKVLKGAGGIGILRKFVSICNNQKSDSDQDLASEYIEAKGGVLEILQLLDKSDKKNTANTAIIFSAMQIVIMKTISKYPHCIINAEQACRHFVNSHLSLVHSMLSSQSTPQHRKICLRLLTAIVTLGGSFPRELLGHLSFHSQTLELLCQHTKPSDLNNVRTCFIHFNISFLVDGSIGVIRSLLDKRDLLASIFPGLIYDPPSIVHLVLNTVKTYVLENNLISKTTKLHLFSTPVLQNFVNLYNWKGPSNWPGINRKKSKSITESINAEDKRNVIETLHEFLLLLLTSTRHGIIFNDKSLGTSGRKYNQSANSILQSLDKPWEHEMPCELVIKILISSPDLIKSQLTSMEAFMVPRLSKKWIQLMQFIRVIVETIDHEQILIPSLNELSLPQLISASLTLAMPQIVLKNAILPAINDTNIILCHEAIKLLTVMMKQMKKILELVEKNNCYDVNYFLKFKGAIRDYIIKNSASMNDIFKAWQQTHIKHKTLESRDGSQDNIDMPTNINHFSAIIELLEIYRDVCPECSEVFDSNNGEEIKPIILLDALKVIRKESCVEKFNELTVKVINFILSINLEYFMTNEEYFGDSLVFLISLLKESEYSEMITNSVKTIEKILILSEVFEGTEDQIEIWIDCFKLLNDKKKIRNVAKWFVEILERTIKQTDKYLNQIIEAEEKVSDNEIIKKDHLENIINELYERNQIGLEIKMAMQPSQSIPLLFCAALDDLKSNSNEDISNYLSYVAILTLHCQINPATLINLTETIETLPNRYLSSWRAANQNYIKKPFHHNDLIRKYSKTLLTNKKITWENIFNDEINCIDDGKVIKYSLTNYEIIILLRVTLFYMTQSVRQMIMDYDQFQRYKSSIIILLSVAINHNKDKKLIKEFSRLIFTNPVLLQHFLPLSIDVNFHSSESMIINELIFEIVKIMKKTEWYNLLLNEEFTLFKWKCLVRMKSLIDKSMNGWRINESIDLAECIELFQLNSHEIFDLLNRIFGLPNSILLSIDKCSLSLWGEIVPRLMETQLNNDEESIENNYTCIEKLLYHLSQFFTKSKGNFDSWIIILNKYYQKYSLNIASINEKIFKQFINSDLTEPAIELPCTVAFEENIEIENVKTIFEMTISHSEFMNTMLGNDFEKKSELLELILRLVRKDHSVMAQMHIPLYLSAYNASLNKCDQLILMILQHYEKANIKFNEYKPYFWGEAAVHYYSIKGEADTALWRQPSTTQVFDLFNINMVTNTIENFPINRNLNATRLSNFTKENVYDPAFYLPLLTYLLSDNNVVLCNRVTQSGALSLVFAACGSECDDVKTAALTVLSRFYFHLEATSHKEKLLWMRILDGLKNGLILPIKDIKISCLVSTFMAKASLVCIQPLHQLYAPIQAFFMAKPALDLHTIPEFLTLFHSSEMNYKIHRNWILGVIRDGIKSEFDVNLALKCTLFRLLFDFYDSILADSSTKNIILEIVNATINVPKAGLLLARGYSLIIWLNNVVMKMNKHDIVKIKLIISVIQSLLKITVQMHDHGHFLYIMSNIAKSLVQKLTNNLDTNSFKLLLIILNDLSNMKSFKDTIEKKDLEKLIMASSKITDVNINECIHILNNGSRFIDREKFIHKHKSCNEKEIDECEKDSIKFNLKKLLINWYSHNSQIIVT